MGEWRHEDGLGVGEKVAVIVGLCEDVGGRMLAKVRWFARPGAVWSGVGPEEGDEVLPVGSFFSCRWQELTRRNSMNSTIRATRPTSTKRAKRGRLEDSRAARSPTLSRLPSAPTRSSSSTSSRTPPSTPPKSSSSSVQGPYRRSA